MWGLFCVVDTESPVFFNRSTTEKIKKHSHFQKLFPDVK